MVRNSRMPGMGRMTLNERRDLLLRHGFLTAEQRAMLARETTLLTPAIADRLVENVVSVFGLPFAIAGNFSINGRDYVLPMVIEEPSVVAGVSGAARLMRANGGIVSEAGEPVLVGQVHLTEIRDAGQVRAILTSRVPDFIASANQQQPRLVARGGGVRRIDFRDLRLPDGQPALVAHIAVDTRDAMGANLVNTICESLAPAMESATGARASLRILSNLAVESLVTARVSIDADLLRTDDFSGEEVRDGIVMANDLAIVDPFRAATHNKGIMNGIDPIAIATGNDWRAIEAAAHAYACRDGQYRALTKWFVGAGGNLCGELSLPIKPGIVGGSLRSNPAARLALDICGVQTASELAEIMCAAGLAQNFAALRALVSKGIQHGHMRLHARSVASAAGAPAEQFNQIVDELIESGEVKEWKARELVEKYRAPDSVDLHSGKVASACGKLILFGEHAVVYGYPALALPMHDGISVRCVPGEKGIRLKISPRGVNLTVSDHDPGVGPEALLRCLLERIPVSDRDVDIDVFSRLPLGMGLGSSAALAAAIARALCAYAGIEASPEEINEMTFACEQIAHGNPSGIDNTIAVFGKPLLYRRDGDPKFEILELEQVPPLLVAWGSEAGSTKEQVAAVAARRAALESDYDSVFAQMGRLAVEGAEALRSADLDKLGAMMNLCHGLLNAIGVSTPELERMIAVSRAAGATGAKLTGAGGGGSIVALCLDGTESVRAALAQAGYQSAALT